ncbi:aminoglycoside phosphotransferase family protein [Sphingomonas abietis]|uniref:Aminoglycoside phosphotransferase family protein n=1 Tax=Sphingomonas abietis TaxID=3012344 RepID=A0ABY7NJF6_9SPHN|nr:aminoglycoside phosphotransferase family protein [Sphingomonas abietis]WBO21377.1 aminoglycoside phosphotransferase family protein [Sphingomonas abietis]
MGLDHWESVQHLLRIGVISPAHLVSSDVSVASLSSRNHLVRVEWPGGGAIVKQPKDRTTADAATMWAEASLFWLATHDPLFAPLAPWMPRFRHYDERQRILTIDYIVAAGSFADGLLGAGLSVPLVEDVGRALATLHGPVSQATAGAPSRRLFAALMPWVLTIGTAEARYVPLTPASATVLQQLMAWPGAGAALQRLRAAWRADQIIHGDVKAPNLLVATDGTARIIDWEIVTLGDGLWDVAGLIHSMLVPNPGGLPEPLDVAQARVRPIAEALWRSYIVAAPWPRAGDAPSMLLAMAGARILQTCLESAHHGVVAPGIPAMLEMAAALMTDPVTARQRWHWPA